MTDWNKNEYKNQYKTETAQVHAPADLIQRTRQAVAEEERKMQTESISGVSEGEKQKVHHRKAYRWALPVAAAAILMLVLHIPAIPRDGAAGGAAADSSPEMEAGADCEEDGAMSGSAETAAEAGSETAASDEYEEDGAAAGMSDICAAPTESGSLSGGDHPYADADLDDRMSEEYGADITEELERKYSDQESEQEDAAAGAQMMEVQNRMGELLKKAYEILFATFSDPERY